MLNIIISFLTFVLILISLFLVLVILMQRANSNAGMGSAFGGGVADSAFGAETTNVLARATKWSAFAFFIISLVLYLLYMGRASDAEKASGDNDLPDIPVVTQAVDQTAPAAADTVQEVGVDALQQAAAAAPATDAPAAEETPAP